MILQPLIQYLKSTINNTLSTNKKGDQGLSQPFGEQLCFPISHKMSLKTWLLLFLSIMAKQGL